MVLYDWVLCLPVCLLTIQVPIKVIHPKYSKHCPYTVAHAIDCMCSKMLNHGLNHFFHISSLYIELCMCWPIWISYMNFRAVLAPPKTACPAQTHESISFIWIVWSTLYVYLWFQFDLSVTRICSIFSRKDQGSLNWWTLGWRGKAARRRLRWRRSREGH